jgi:hypothetical protein
MDNSHVPAYSGDRLVQHGETGKPVIGRHYPDSDHLRQTISAMAAQINNLAPSQRLNKTLRNKQQ